MVEHEIVTTDAEIEAALKSGKVHDGDPVARTVEYIQGLNLLIVGLSNGHRMALPIEDIQGLRNARQEQIQNYVQ